MRLMKKVMLGSAAGLVAVSAAGAADLGAKKPAAVAYVKTCPTYGAGFFVIPGTNSCLKMAGRVRADYMIENPTARSSNANRFRVRGYVAFDHRTATEYGMLRTFMRAYFQRENGADSTVLEQAYIQFGGFTAGRVTPLWEHSWSPWFAGSNNYGGYSFILYTNTLRYTMRLNSEISATLAMEDASERQRTITGGTAAGRAMPHFVGSLDYTAGFGSLKLMGAVAQIRELNAVRDTTYGYAIGAAGKINLPFASKGSNLWFNTVYTSGAVSYAGYNTIAIGSFSRGSVDATVSGTSLKATKAWALAGGVQIYVTPTVWTSLGGSYANYDPFGPANTLKTYAIVGQLGWQPTSSFLIASEVYYRNISGSAGTVAAGFGTRGNDKSDWVGRLRVQRDF